MAMLADYIDAGKISVDMFVASGCPWSTHRPDVGDAGRACAAMQPRLFHLLDRTARTYDAIVTTSWVLSLPGTRAERVRGLTEAWGRVTRQGVPVLALRDNPSVDDPQEDPNRCLAGVAPARANEQCALDRSSRLDRWFDPYRVAAERTPGAQEIDLSRFFCDHDRCPVVIGGVNVYADDNHMTVTYAKTLGPYLIGALRKAGVLRG